MEKQPAVYIMTNKSNSVLYTGVTSNLLQRVWQHKEKVVKGFTEKYNITKLVYYELFERMEDAILREKKIKGGSRARKISLIESMNLQWVDLYEKIT